MSFRRIISVITAAALLLTPIQGFAQTLPAQGGEVVSAAALKAINGYKLLKTTYSEELAANVYEYEHIKSGGKVVYVAANDAHKVMDVIVKTPASDQTGANHVLEHALLSGSEKYPTKSPFNTVASTSVNTYANALTYDDRTVFTFSTENAKDFDNLKRIYLDGIFAPKLLKDDRIFKREGWRYQFTTKGDLSYTGVVYSEMMGMYADPGVIHQQGIYAALYPNTTYANDSGGIPEKIVNLSADQLRSVYKKYYQPANMLIYYYGNVNLPEELKFLDQNYWSKYTKQTVKLDYGTAASPDKDVTFKNQFHVDRAEDTKDNTMISMNYMLPTTMSKKDRLGLNLLLYFLVRTETAPLYGDFVDAGLGSQFQGYADIAQRYPVVTLSMGNSNASEAEGFKEFLNSSLNYYANKGLDPQILKNELSTMTLNAKLKSLAAYTGNNARESVELGFTTFNDPLYFFDNASIEAEILKEAQSSDYFQKLIKTYLLDAKRTALVITEPRQGLNDIKSNAISQQLKEKYSKMTAGEKKKIAEDIEAFKVWNNAVDSPELQSKLPMLKLSDISYQLEKENRLEETMGTTQIYSYVRDTNGITDLSLYFDISNLNDQERLDLQLLQAYFLNMPTRNRPLKELVDIMARSTNGLTTNTMIFTGDDNYALSANRFYVNSSFLGEDLPGVINVFNEIFNYQRFDSKPFVKYVADEMASRLASNMTTELDDIAYSSFNQYMTPLGAQYAKDMSTEAAYQYFKNLSQSVDQDYSKVLKRLMSVYDKVFCRDNLVVSITTDQQNLETSQRQVKDMILKLKRYDISSAQMPQAASFKTLSHGPIKEGIIASTQVAYVYNGFNLNQMKESFKGSYLVFAQLINNQYAHQELREKNGAYGGYFSAQSSGTIFFSSYRDPNLVQSLKSMADVTHWLKAQKLSQQDLDPIIVSIVGQLNQPDNVLVKADSDVQNTISGKSQAENERLIHEVLMTTPEDLAAFIAILEKGFSQSNVVVVGSEQQINEQSSFFDTIRLLSK